jgi:diguanylate cyclase (GGDEF)-like protein
MKILAQRSPASDSSPPEDFFITKRPTGVLQQFRCLLSPSADFVEKKYLDHRIFSAMVCLILAIVSPSLWVWDLVTDPVGAANTLVPRLLYLLIFAVALAYVFAKHDQHVSPAFPVLAALFGEALFIEILNRLEGGMTYGLAGFMYFMILGIIGLQCYSLLLNFAYTVLAAATPHLLAFAGLAHDFPHAQYAVLIWPAAAMTIFAQAAIAQNYLRRYESERQLEQLSNTDPLTGVSNRRYFMPLLGREMLRARRLPHGLSLLMLDIDHFKQVNDAHGHPTGDLVICLLTELCRRVSREIDVVARLGGEEFAVLLPGSDIRQARGVAERIRVLVEATPVQSLEAGTFHFTVSIGAAELCAEDAGAADLLGRADAALYEAKEGGRNQVVLNQPSRIAPFPPRPRAAAGLP